MLTLRGVKMLARMNSVPRDKTGTDWTASTVAAKRALGDSGGMIAGNGEDAADQRAV